MSKQYGMIYSQKGALCSIVGNECLLLHRYQASRDDLAVYSALSSAPSSSSPHALRWYKHITALLGARSVYSLSLIQSSLYFFYRRSHLPRKHKPFSDPSLMSECSATEASSRLMCYLDMLFSSNSSAVGGAKATFLLLQLPRRE